MEKTFTLKWEVTWQSSEYMPAPERVSVQITPKVQELIKKALAFATMNETDVSIPVDYSLFSDGELFMGWTPDYRQGKLIVMSTGSIYFYTQSKHDASIQVEAGGFNFNQIKEQWEEE